MERRWFKPLHGKQRVRRICAFDVEGRGGPGGFVCGAIVSDAGPEFHLDPEAMFESLLEHAARGEWVLAHNLEYDLPIVAGRRLLEGDLLFKDTGLLWATYPVGKRKAVFYDSTNLFPRMSVRVLGELCGLPKLQVETVALRGLSSSAAFADFSPVEQASTLSYCARDAEIVYRAVALLQDELATLGAELRPTIAGCALDLYRRRFHKWPWPALGPETNRLARGAFYGGRTENFVMGRIEGVNMYDVNSLYPFVQETASFPHPSHLRLDGGPLALDDLKGREGVAQALLSVPEAFCPPLPHRFTSRLFFPIGTMRGCWTLSELRAARERGTNILEIDWALSAAKTFNPFKEYVDTLWGKRQGYIAADDGRQAIAKLLLNSLYGRFGLNPDESLWKLQPWSPDPGDGSHRGFVTSEVNGEPVMMGPVQGKRYPTYVNVLIAAQVASAARLHLLEAMESQDEDLVYCDTDSVITRGGLPEGDWLGSWRCQMRNGSADLLGPKEYLLHDQVLGEQAVVKGVPGDMALAYIRSGSARFRRALRVREALAQGKDPAEWVEVTKEHGTVVPKRCPVLLGDDLLGDFTLTMPWDVRELPDLVSPPPSPTYLPSRALSWQRREGSAAYIQSLP